MPNYLDILDIFTDVKMAVLALVETMSVAFCYIFVAFLDPIFHSSSAASKDDFNFLHKSIMPTDHFQRSLPRLPIPKLEDTCGRYLKAVEPLLSQADLQRTTKVVESFRDGEGKGNIYSILELHS